MAPPNDERRRASRTHPRRASHTHPRRVWHTQPRRVSHTHPNSMTSILTALQIPPPQCFDGGGQEEWDAYEDSYNEWYDDVIAPIEGEWRGREEAEAEHQRDLDLQAKEDEDPRSRQEGWAEVIGEDGEVEGYARISDEEGDSESGESVYVTTCDVCEKVSALRSPELVLTLTSLQEIVGVRHKCLTCPDYDLCSRCHKSSSEKHPGHRFFALTEAESETGEEQAGSNTGGDDSKIDADKPKAEAPK
jgi:hypothetical protein